MQFEKLEKLLERVDHNGRLLDDTHSFRKGTLRAGNPASHFDITKARTLTSKSSSQIKTQLDSFIKDRNVYRYQRRNTDFQGSQRLASKDKFRKSSSKYKVTSPSAHTTMSDKVYPGQAPRRKESPTKVQSPKKGKNPISFSEIYVKHPATASEYKDSVSTLQTQGKLDKYKPRPQLKKFFNQVDIKDLELIRKIGSGKFSDVFLARDRKTEFLGALKIIKKSQINSTKMMNQFVREIKIHSFTKHPNIVSLYSSFCDQGHVYLLEEYGSDGQLYKRLKQVGTFSEKAVSYIVRSLLDALQYLHSNNILHRDIKPENIVLVHGNVKICDFGWSVFEPSKLRSTLCGTPLYTCPQLVKGQKYSDKIDLWTLGMLSYQLYFGYIPFKIEDEQDLEKIATDQIKFPNNIKCSPELQDFVLQLLKKDPRERLTAAIMLMHPFIQRYNKVEVCEELCF